jgi:hypothetical protein
MRNRRHPSVIRWESQKAVFLRGVPTDMTTPRNPQKSEGRPMPPTPQVHLLVWAPPLHPPRIALHPPPGRKLQRQRTDTKKPRFLGPYMQSTRSKKQRGDYPRGRCRIGSVDVQDIHKGVTHPHPMVLLAMAAPRRPWGVSPNPEPVPRPVSRSRYGPP